MKLFRNGVTQLLQQFQHVQTPVELSQAIGGDKFVAENALQGALEDMLNESTLRLFLDFLLSSASSLDDNFNGSDLELEAPKVSMSRSVCRAFLAQAFLGNIALDPVKDRKAGVWYHSCYGLNFDTMFWSDANWRPVAVEKIKCLVQYFLSTHVLDTDNAHNNEVFFSRISVPGVSSLGGHDVTERNSIE